VLGGLAPARQAFGDRGVDRAPARRDLADRADELVALRDPVLQQVGEPALALAEERDRVRLVVVGREHDDARRRMLLADRVRAVDPLELEVRGHLDVVTDDVGNVLGRGREERRGVLGHADDLDVVVGVQECPNALADEDVVLAEDDPDAHATCLSDDGTMRAWCGWSSRRITTSSGRGPRHCSRPPRRSS
jgi:hypothetical protein